MTKAELQAVAQAIGDQLHAAGDLGFVVILNCPGVGAKVVTNFGRDDAADMCRDVAEDLASGVRLYRGNAAGEA